MPSSAVFFILSFFLTSNLLPSSVDSQPDTRLTRQLWLDYDHPGYFCDLVSEENACSDRAKAKWNFNIAGTIHSDRNRCCCIWDAINCSISAAKQKCSQDYVRFIQKRINYRPHNVTVVGCDSVTIDCRNYWIDSPNCQTASEQSVWYSSLILWFAIFAVVIAFAGFGVYLLVGAKKQILPFIKA